MIEHSDALVALQREHKKHLEREKALGEILDTLRSGYNPNYQDMAVLEAVRGWEELSGLPHIGEAEKETSEDATSEAGDADEKAEDTITDEGKWTAERLETDLDALVNTNYVSLLLEHEEHIRTPIEGSQCKSHTS